MNDYFLISLLFFLLLGLGLLKKRKENIRLHAYDLKGQELSLNNALNNSARLSRCSVDYIKKVIADAGETPDTVSDIYIFPRGFVEVAGYNNPEKNKVITRNYSDINYAYASEREHKQGKVVNALIKQHKKQIDSKFSRQFGKKRWHKYLTPEFTTGQKSEILRSGKYEGKTIDELTNELQKVKEAKKELDESESAINYDNLQKLVENQEYLTETEKGKLQGKIKKEAETVDFTDIKDDTEKYKILKRYSKDVEGLEEVYKESKKKAVTQKIGEIDETEIYENEKSVAELQALANASRDTGLEKELVEKYVQKYESMLEDPDNKINLLKSILDNEKFDLGNETVTSAVRDKVIKDELRDLKNQTNNFNEEISGLKNNLFSVASKEINHNRKKLVEELSVLEDKGKLSNEIKVAAAQSDKDIIVNAVNYRWVSNILAAVGNNKTEPGDSPLLQDFEESEELIVDQNLRKSLFDIIPCLSTDKLLEHEEIKDELNKQLKKEDGHKNDLAEAIWDLAQYMTHKEGTIQSDLNGEIEEPSPPQLKTDLGNLIFEKIYEKQNKDLKSIAAALGPYNPETTTEDDIRRGEEINRQINNPEKTPKTSDTNLIIPGDIPEHNPPEETETPPTPKIKTKPQATPSDEFVFNPEKIDSILEEIEKKGSYKKVRGSGINLTSAIKALKPKINDGTATDEEQDYFNKIRKVLIDNTQN